MWKNKSYKRHSPTQAQKCLKHTFQIHGQSQKLTRNEESPYQNNSRSTYEPVITGVNQIKWTMLIIWIDTTKIWKQFVSTDKDLVRIKQLSPRQLYHQWQHICIDTTEGNVWKWARKGVRHQTDRMTLRQLYADIDINFQKAYTRRWSAFFKLLINCTKYLLYVYWLLI